MQSLAAFAVFAAVLTVTPGLDTMIVLRATAATGRWAGLAAVVGVCAGCVTWALASALGVTAVLAASRLAFEVMRIAGVVYLCWLGVRALWRARRPGTPPETVVSTVDILGAFRMGLTTNLLNPKVGVFYLSVMPQFLPPGVNPLAGSLALGAIHVAEGFVWLSLVVLAVNWARGWLTRPSVKRRLEQLTGVALLAFGLRLAFDPGPR